MTEYAALPPWAKAPTYCMACGTLSKRPAGLDAEGHPVCPQCYAVNVYLADPADGVRVVEEDGVLEELLDVVRAHVEQQEQIAEDHMRGMSLEDLGYKTYTGEMRRLLDRLDGDGNA